KIASNASAAARRVEELTPPTVVLPPEPPEGGYALSPILTLTVSTGRPRVSAATIAITVRVPVPRSCEPSSAETDPSGLIVTLHSLACGPPPHVCIERPSPFLMWPPALSPRRCHFLFHSMISA